MYGFVVILFLLANASVCFVLEIASSLRTT